MKLLVGLGNPGAKYARNRHNIGFMAVDAIAGAHGFGPWRQRFRGEAAEGRLGTEKVLLLKPGTYMNRSGDAVAEALRFFKLGTEALVVFHDELDLAPGKLRVKAGGGHAGHNGLRSIMGHLGAEFTRVRMGIGHPGHKDAVSGYVLHDFARAEEGWLDDLLRGISDGAAALAAGDAGRFQNAVALRVAPPRASGGAAFRGAASGAAKGAGKPKAAPSGAPERPAQDRSTAPDAARTSDQTPADAPADAPAGPPRSALQRLIDRFR